MGKSIDFVPFMASKDTETLILVFTFTLTDTEYFDLLLFSVTYRIFKDRIFMPGGLVSSLKLNR